MQNKKQISVPTRCLHTTGPEPRYYHSSSSSVLPFPPSPQSEPSSSTSTPASTSRTLFSLVLIFPAPCHQLVLAAGRFGVASHLLLLVSTYNPLRLLLLIHPLITHLLFLGLAEVSVPSLSGHIVAIAPSHRSKSHRIVPRRSAPLSAAAHPIVYFVSAFDLALSDTSTPPPQPPPAWWLQLGLVHHWYLF